MKFANKLKETTSATSAASITLTGAVQYFRSLAKSIALGKLAVGDTNVCFMVDDGAGNWEEGLYTITSSTVITRTSIVDSSNDGAAVTFAAGSKTVSNMISAEWASKILSSDDGVTSTGLSALGSVSGTTKLLALDASGGIVTAAVSLLPNGSASAPADSSAPTTPGSLSSSGVGQTAATLNYTASTDNVGVSYYEVSKDSTTWTNNGTALSYAFTGLTAGTTYTFQVRAVDAAGNKSTAASLQVTTAAASGDTTAPTMSGSIATSSVTATGFTMAYSAGSDNVAVTKYEVSIDGGANYVNNGTNLSYSKTGATASTTYNLRVRCYDAAGNVSNVLSGTVTTSAAAAQVNIVVTPHGSTAGKPLAKTANGDWVYAGGADGTTDQFISVSGLGTAALAYGWGASDTVAPTLVTNSTTNTGADVKIDAGYMSVVTANGLGFYSPPDYMWIRGVAGTYSRWLWAQPVDAVTRAPVGPAVRVSSSACVVTVS